MSSFRSSFFAAATASGLLVTSPAMGATPVSDPLREAIYNPQEAKPGCTIQNGPYRLNVDTQRGVVTARDLGGGLHEETRPSNPAQAKIFDQLIKNCHDQERAQAARPQTAAPSAGAGVQMLNALRPTGAINPGTRARTPKP